MNKKRMVRYYWTEDGCPETCFAEETEVQETTCYHCGLKLVGKAIKLTSLKDNDVYYIHEECFKKVT